jgi:hypothetical protein
MKSSRLPVLVFVACAAVGWLSGCSKTSSTQQTGPNAQAAGRPPENFLDERLLEPNPQGYLLPTATTVAQVESYYGGLGGPMRWRRVSDGSYALETNGKDALTGKPWTLTLMVSAASLHEGMDSFNIEKGERYAHIERAILNGEELADPDIKIGSTVFNQKIPLPAKIIERRQALTPKCDSQRAHDLVAERTKLGDLWDPSTTNGTQLLDYSKPTETLWKSATAERDCSALVQLDVGPRKIWFWMSVSNGVLSTKAGQDFYQPRPTPIGSAAPSAAAQTSDTSAYDENRKPDDAAAGAAAKAVAEQSGKMEPNEQLMRRADLY